jgi:hypothetical protein
MSPDISFVLTDLTYFLIVLLVVVTALSSCSHFTDEAYFLTACTTWSHFYLLSYYSYLVLTLLTSLLATITVLLGDRTGDLCNNFQNSYALTNWAIHPDIYVASELALWYPRPLWPNDLRICSAFGLNGGSSIHRQHPGQ